jgi:hypothetical protein
MHSKFAASSMLPVPLYTARCGNGQSGRVRFTPGPLVCDATMDAGAWPASTHCSSAVSASKVFGPPPPPQWYMPGAMNRRVVLHGASSLVPAEALVVL